MSSFHLIYASWSPKNWFLRIGLWVCMCVCNYVTVCDLVCDKFTLFADNLNRMEHKKCLSGWLLCDTNFTSWRWKKCLEFHEILYLVKASRKQVLFNFSCTSLHRLLKFCVVQNNLWQTVSICIAWNNWKFYIQFTYYTGQH